MDEGPGKSPSSASRICYVLSAVVGGVLKASSTRPAVVTLAATALALAACHIYLQRVANNLTATSLDIEFWKDCRDRQIGKGIAKTRS